MSKPKKYTERPTPPPMVDRLRADVAHDEARLELSRRLLRDWIREHPDQEEEKSVVSIYETRDPHVFTWPRDWWLRR